MRRLKQILAIILAVSMIIAAVPITVMAEDQKVVAMPSEWAVAEVKLADSMGFVPDRLTDNYQKDITREEFCEVVVRLYTEITGVTPEIVSTNFEDTDNEDVARAYGLGIVKGVSETSFEPDVDITRQEMCTMLVRCIDKAIFGVIVDKDPDMTELEKEYADVADVDEWARSGVYFAIEHDIMKGNVNGTIKKICPLDNTTREEALLLVWRVYDNRDDLAFLTVEEIVDTDYDGLTDDEEINTYKTNPELADTDGDGIDDGWEIYAGTDPNKKDEKVEMTVGADELPENHTVAASATVELEGEQVGTLEISPVPASKEPLLSATIPGYMGVAYEFSVEGSFKEAKVQFLYDSKAFGKIDGEFKPRIYKLNEEDGTLTKLKNQIVKDGKINVEVNDFAKYVLLNSVEYDAAWEADIKAPSYNAEDRSGYLDVVFVIDESGSMESNKSGTVNDPNRERVSAVKSFIDDMSEGDRAAIIGFSEENDVRVLCELTEDLEEAKTQTDNIVGNSGGTAIYAGIEAGIDEMYANGRDDAEKILVVLTDGTDDPTAPEGKYDEVIDYAGSAITIYTVGLGSSVDKILLTHIADSTGGKYFHASAAEELKDGLELVKDETIDYVKDSNNDGISDYYTELIFTGTLRLSNGSQQFIGADLSGNPDMDGDGLLNGEELVIVEKDSKVMVRYISDPTINDTDLDGYTDDIDKHPLNPDYLSQDASDFRQLTDNALYEYTMYVEKHRDDFGAQFAESLVLGISFTDIQKEYTEEMAQFFVKNMSQDKVDEAIYNEYSNICIDVLDQYLAMEIANAVDNIKENVDNAGEVVDTTLDLALSSEKRAVLKELYAKRLDARINLLDARLAGKSTKSIGGYQSWVTRYSNIINDVKGDSSHVVLLKKGIGTPEFSKKTRKFFNGLDKFGKALDWAGVVFDSATMIVDVAEIGNFADTLAKYNADCGVLTDNIELLEELEHNGGNQYTRDAASFMLTAIGEGYAEVMTQQIEHIMIKGTGIALDVALIFATGPIGVAVSVAKAVIGICDAIFGWSDTAKTRGRVICLYDISKALCTMVNKYYLYDDVSKEIPEGMRHSTEDTFVKYVTGLVNARIAGEAKYKEIGGIDATAIGYANENIIMVKKLADKLGVELSVDALAHVAEAVG